MNYVSEFLSGKWLQQAKDYLSNPEKMKELIKAAKDYACKEGLAKVKDKLVLMYEYVSDIIKGNYSEYGMANLVIVVAALIYVVSPLDLVPDVIVGLGLLDDAAIVTWALGIVDSELTKYSEWKGKSLK